MSTNSLLGQLGDRMPFLFYLGKNFVGHNYPMQSASCVVELKGQYRLRAYFPATSHHGMLAHLHKSKKYLAAFVFKPSEVNCNNLVGGGSGDLWPE